MEENRLIVVLLLVLILTFLFMTFSSHPQPVQKKRPPQQPQKRLPIKKTPDKPPPKIKGEGPLKGVMKTRFLQMEWQRDGGVIYSLKLIEKEKDRFVYPSPKDKERPLTLIYPLRGVAPLQILKPSGLVFSSRVVSKNEVLFHARKDGLLVRKRIQVGGDPLHKYDITFVVEFENTKDTHLELEEVLLVASCGMSKETRSDRYEGGVVCRKEEGGYDLNETSVGSVEEKKPVKFEGPFWYFGLVNKYFAFVLIPEGDVPLREVRLRRLKKEEKPKGFKEEEVQDLLVETVLGSVKIAPKSKVRYEFTIYAGPRAEETVGVHRAVGLDRLVSYGLFGFLSRLFLAILSAIHYLLPNWGIAIIVLTFIVRGALHPVSRKQQVALIRYQHKIRKIQPEIEKIRKKYHNDRRRMNEEIMKLFRKHKVPMVPAGGCLLMFLQIPVFIGLYQALNRSIILRQTSFLWISDLAQPDRLFRLPFTIPLIGTDFFNLLPVLTLVVMILQTKLQHARMPSAQQGQTFTYLMYAFLTFVLYNLPAGLILYFFTSTVVGLVEGWLVRRYIERAHPELVTS